MGKKGERIFSIIMSVNLLVINCRYHTQMPPPPPHISKQDVPVLHKLFRMQNSQPNL